MSAILSIFKDHLLKLNFNKLFKLDYTFKELKDDFKFC